MAGKLYIVGILARGRGYRKLKVRGVSKAVVRREAKFWLETGTQIGVFNDYKEEAKWLKAHGYA